MNIVTLDFETYWDDEFTLKKLTTEAYVRDPRFEVLGVGVRWNNQVSIVTEWYTAKRFRDYIVPKTRWENVALLCHHAHFDGLILSHHFGIKPYAWLDTLSMARLLLGNHLSVSLDNLARHFGLAGKTVPYDAFKGKHWPELDPSVQKQVADGCLHDVALTYRLFEILSKDFPPEEYAVVDQTVRMFTEPTLIGDIDALAAVWTSEQLRKADFLRSLGVTSKILQSADDFAELLRREGIEPERKAGKNEEIYAFAKTDDFMKSLLEHDDDRVRTLAEARLGVRSTIDQTRAERLGFAATRGALPVYLGYAAAHTTRWGGGDKVNWQNFRRGGEIRKAIRAPEGHVIIKADKSQVECHFLNFVAGQWDVVEKFRNKEDPYVGIASRAYGFEVTKNHPTERGTGKQLELSCGYGAGAETIVRTAARGTYGPSVRIELVTGLAWRDLYRDTHPAVVQLWKDAGRMIARLAGGTSIQWGPVTVQTGRIILPNGCPMLYPDLEFYRPEPYTYVNGVTEETSGYWRYRSRKGWVKLYGAKLVENLIQGIARVDMSQTMLRLRALGYRIVLTEHDSLAVVVKNDAQLDTHVATVTMEMCRSPVWLPEIPLGAEVTVGERYS